MRSRPKKNSKAAVGVVVPAAVVAVRAAVDVRRVPVSRRNLQVQSLQVPNLRVQVQGGGAVGRAAAVLLPEYG